MHSCIIRRTTFYWRGKYKFTCDTHLLILLLLKSFQWWVSGLRCFHEHTPPFISVSMSIAWVVHVNWLMRQPSGYYATCYSSPWVGQRSGHRLGNKTLLWVFSGCSEYSFDVGQVSDVDTYYIDPTWSLPASFPKSCPLLGSVRVRSTG